MASIKDLKKRIGTVKNTQQTTRAMKMVSAAKLRRAQDAIQNQRPYAKRILDLIRELASVVGTKGDKSLLALMKKEDSASSGDRSKKTLLVVVTSDRGLCGAFNSNVIKGTTRWIQSHASTAGEVQMAFVGRKGYEFFKNRKANIAAYFPEAGGKVTFQKAKKLADALIDRFQKGEVDEIKIVYNEFKNAVTQNLVVENFLPLDPIEAGKKDSAKENQVAKNYIVKPSPEAVFSELVSKNFAIQTFRILLESQAGEHGARMSAMENATKNAGEMIKKLTLQYNKQRQAGITKELLEIIAGSESQKG